MEVNTEVLKVVPIIAPAAALTATTEGLVIDTKGYENLTFVVASGATMAGLFDLTVKEAAAHTGTLGTDAALTDGTDATLIGTAPSLAAGDVGVIEKCGVKLNPSKRYVRATLTETTASTGSLLAVVAILSNPRVAPVS